MGLYMYVYIYIYIYICVCAFVCVRALKGFYGLYDDVEVVRKKGLWAVCFNYTCYIGLTREHDWSAFGFYLRWSVGWG